MWNLALVATALSFAPAQPPAPAAGPLALTNLRTTFGEQGGPRDVKGLIPGDILFVCFDIEGIQIDETGKVQYQMFIELTDAAGKSYHKTEPTNNVNFIPLGGNKIPGRAYITVGFDQAPGDYNLTVHMTDMTNKATKNVTQKFTVLPKDFGIVAVYMSIDERGAIPAPTTGMVGQSLFIQFGLVNFARSADKKMPNIAIEMVPLDDKGTPTLGKPNVFNLDGGVKEEDPVVTVRYLLPLTRAGKFTVRLKATDKISGKSYTFNLPVTALANN